MLKCTLESQMTLYIQTLGLNLIKYSIFGCYGIGKECRQIVIVSDIEIKGKCFYMVNLEGPVTE